MPLVWSLDRDRREVISARSTDDLKYVGLIVHDLRRTGARNLRREGESETVIMKAGGWKTPSVFKRYDIVDEADLDRAAERLNEKRRRLAAQNVGISSRIAQLPVEEKPTIQ